MATSTTADLDYRPSYRAALVVSLVTLVLYLLTLAPSTAMWDTSEYIAAAYTLGLPHPPGNPLFVILGRVFSILPIASSVAVRINILGRFAARRPRACGSSLPSACWSAGSRSAGSALPAVSSAR